MTVLCVHDCLISCHDCLKNLARTVLCFRGGPSTPGARGAGTPGSGPKPGLGFRVGVLVAVIGFGPSDFEFVA